MQGRVVETGSPSELLAAGGRYADLWARQASLDDVASSDAPSDASHPASPEDGDQVRHLQAVVLHPIVLLAGTGWSCVV